MVTNRGLGSVCLLFPFLAKNSAITRYHGQVKYEIDPLADSNTETYRYRSVKPFIHFPNHQD